MWAVIILQSNIGICRGNMYHNRIDLILTFLGLFLITNVFGAPGTLAKNQTSTGNESLTEDQIDELIEEMPSDHPYSELDLYVLFAL